LGLDDDQLVACVACGLCLPHCPTYRVTGLEIASPRGRIAAMRAVEWHDAPMDAAFERAMDECVQCRGCEAACPSSVPFGALMEATRAAMPPRGGRGRRGVEVIAYRFVLPVHAVLVAVTWLLAAAQRLHLVPRRFGIPWLRMGSLRRPLDVPPGGAPDAWMFTGCVMDAWMRDTHRATAAVMRAAGATPGRPDRGADCCGALHLHAGRIADARRLAEKVIGSMPGDAPVVVNSAGCGTAMKEYGSLLRTDAARAFSARVRDFSEWLVETGVPALTPTGESLVVQDPCHLRHVQRRHEAVRTALAGAYELVDTDDDGLCCGAGGAYAALQPELATEVRDRKLAALRRAAPGARVVSANPGCLMHLQAGGAVVCHPADLLAAALAPGLPASTPPTREHEDHMDTDGR
jgi:glycolate oxidase iron-sulfur subunit